MLSICLDTYLLNRDHPSFQEDPEGLVVQGYRFPQVCHAFQCQPLPSLHAVQHLPYHRGAQEGHQNLDYPRKYTVAYRVYIIYSSLMSNPFG